MANRTRIFQAGEEKLHYGGLAATPAILRSRSCHVTTGAPPSRGAHPAVRRFTAKETGRTRTGLPYEIVSFNFSSPPDLPESGGDGPQISWDGDLPGLQCAAMANADTKGKGQEGMCPNVVRKRSVMVLIALAVPTSVHAHAALVRSVPGSRAVLTQSPHSLDLCL